MSYGLQVFNSSGVKTLDTTNRLSQFIGSFNVTYQAQTLTTRQIINVSYPQSIENQYFCFTINSNVGAYGIAYNGYIETALIGNLQAATVVTFLVFRV